MPPVLSDDIFLLIGQRLQSLDCRKTLSNLSLSCKTNYQLLTPLVYRHVILTDHSLPKLFTRIIDIPNGEKHAFMQPIKEEVNEEDDIPLSSLTPTRRLRVQLRMVFKMTVDTNNEQFPYEILTTIAKCLMFYFDDMLFPRVSRLVFTAKHGTSRRIGLLSSDKDPYHLLRNFLPVACQPKYICCSFNPSTPACLNGILAPAFTMDADHEETVNIHQARVISVPPKLTNCRISFGQVGCPRGKDCTLQGHPVGCEKAEMKYRLTQILVGSSLPTHINSAIPLENSSPGAAAHRSDQNVTIVERTDHNGLTYHQVYKEMIENAKKTNDTTLPFPPDIMQFLHSVAVNGGVMTGFGPNGPVVTPIGGFGNNGGDGNSNVGGSVMNNNNNNGNTNASSTSNGNAHANTASHTSTPNAPASNHQYPTFIPGGAGLSFGLPNFTSTLNGINNNANNVYTGTNSSANTASSHQNMANGNPAISVNMSSMFNARTSLPDNSSGPANGTGTAPNSAGGNSGHQSQPAVPDISFASGPTEMTPQDPAKIPSDANIRFVVGEAAERCEACGEPI